MRKSAHYLRLIEMFKLSRTKGMAQQKKEEKRAILKLEVLELVKS
jgi:hypothetical protein